MSQHNKPDTSSIEDICESETCEYEVGYKKPPVATRFKPGQSGNRKGRPKGAKGSSNLVDAALNQRVRVTKGGKSITISKREAMYEQQVNKAASGDPKAFKIIANFDQLIEAKRDADKPKQIPVTDSDAEVIKSFADRMRDEQLQKTQEIEIVKNKNQDGGD
jgi:hypothetical protein